MAIPVRISIAATTAVANTGGSPSGHRRSL